MAPMPSEQLQLLIAGYVLGDLDSNEAAEFEQLLAENPAIAAEVAHMQKALEQSYAPVEVTPPAHLRSKIFAALEAEQQAQSQPAPPDPFTDRFTNPSTNPPTNPWVSVSSTSNATRRSGFWNRVWNPAVGIAAAVLIAVLGINNYRLWQALQTTQTDIRSDIQSADTRTYTLQSQTPNATAATATIVVNPESLEALLTVQNLPPPPPGQTYVLWTVVAPNAPVTVDDKSAILTAVLNPDAQGNIAQTITVPEVHRSEDLVQAVAITLEDAAAPQVHAGAPILITDTSRS
jgi:hypothetical protein